MTFGISKASPAASVLPIAIFGLLSLALALDLGERATLVDPIAPEITIASVAVSVAAGVWLGLNVKPPAYMGQLRRTIAQIGLPIIFAVAGSFLARVAVETVAFAGLKPSDGPITAFVTNKASGKWGQRSAFVSFGLGTREVEIPITSALDDQLQPWRAPGRDCLSLTVETGRWGIRRTMLPRKFFDDPYDTDRYRPCGRQR